MVFSGDLHTVSFTPQNSNVHTSCLNCYHDPPSVNCENGTAEAKDLVKQAVGFVFNAGTCEQPKASGSILFP